MSESFKVILAIAAHQGAIVRRCSQHCIVLNIKPGGHKLFFNFGAGNAGTVLG